MIYAEMIGLNISIVTRGGAAKGAYHNTQHGQRQMHLAEQKKSPIDIQKPKEIFLDVRL